MKKVEDRYSKKPPVFYKNPPSEEFMLALEDTFHSGTVMADCDLCGRTTYHHKEYEWAFEGDDDEDEKAFLENAEKYPEWYVCVDYSIPFGTFDGKQVVIGCPCNGLRKYENLFWRHSYTILKYLKNRTEKDLKDAQSNHEEVFDLLNVLKEK